MHYLDNASTTPVAPAAIRVVEEILQRHWANPSSLYRAGAEAEARLEAARKTLAAALGCGLRELHFTASGTEANNIAIFGAARVRAGWANELVTTGYEHPAGLKPLQQLAKREGFTLRQVAPGPDGRVDVSALLAAVGPKTALVSAMQVNNETGATLDVATLAAAVKAKNPRCFVHVDGVQAFCKQPLKLSATRIDSYAVSGHKLGAPKGVGALYMRAGGNFVPLMEGGGQEGGVRPGTENLAYAAAFAAVAGQAMEQLPAYRQQMEALRARLLAGLEALEGEVRVHSPADGAPGIVMFSLPRGIRSEVMLHHLDDKFEVQVSGGSACGRGQPSYTLTAMNLPADQVEAAIRVSFGGQNTAQDVDALLAGLADGLATLTRGRPGERC